MAIVSQQSDGGTDGDDDSVSVVESELLIYLTAKAGALLDPTGEIRGIGEWPFLCSRCEWKEGRMRNKGLLFSHFFSLLFQWVPYSCFGQATLFWDRRRGERQQI